MKIRVYLPRTKGIFNPAPMVDFALKKIRQIDNPENTEPDPIWMALLLAAAVDDSEFHDRFKKMIIASSDEPGRILAMSHMFLSVLDLLPPDHSTYTGRCCSSDEAICQDILQCALSEGTRMLSEECLYLDVFRLLVRSGLQFYNQQLSQFEEMCSNTDPVTLVHRGIQIATVAMSREATN